jgi:hypothetical protein
MALLLAVLIFKREVAKFSSPENWNLLIGYQLKALFATGKKPRQDIQSVF